MAFFWDKFPYTNLHSLNLDWIIDRVKECMDAVKNTVKSVNGRTGDVTGVYDLDNPPPYPVTSVNGMTGDVTVQAGVTSVNGQTGAITGVYKTDNPPPYPVTSVNGRTGAVNIDAGDVNDLGINQVIVEDTTRSEWTQRTLEDYYNAGIRFIDSPYRPEETPVTTDPNRANLLYAIIRYAKEDNSGFEYVPALVSYQTPNTITYNDVTGVGTLVINSWPDDPDETTELHGSPVTGSTPYTFRVFGKSALSRDVSVTPPTPSNPITITNIEDMTVDVAGTDDPENPATYTAYKQWDLNGISLYGLPCDASIANIVIDGTPYIADYVDLAAGKIVRMNAALNLGDLTRSGSIANNRAQFNNPYPPLSYSSGRATFGYCTHYRLINTGATPVSDTDNAVSISNNYIFITDSRYTPMTASSAASMIEYLQTAGATLIFPVKTPLIEEIPDWSPIKLRELTGTMIESGTPDALIHFCYQGTDPRFSTTGAYDLDSFEIPFKSDVDASTLSTGPLFSTMDEPPTRPATMDL